MSNLPDIELIERARRGNKGAYNELFERYSDRLVNFIRKYVGDHQMAEDIVIETFLDVYKRLRYYREEGKFTAWIFKIALNFARKEFRKRKVKEISFDTPQTDENTSCIGEMMPDNSMRPDSAAASNELSLFIDRFVLGMDERYRNALLLCDFEGMSYEEAADVMKTCESTVGTWLDRARKLLYTALEEHGYLA